MSPEDRSNIEALLGDLCAAWEAGDGSAYAACFSPDAPYTTFVGTSYRGAADIGHSHDVLFGSFLKGTKLAYEIVELSVVTPDVALALTRGDTVKGSVEGKRLKKVQLYVFVRDPAYPRGWKIAAFHNTQHRSLMEQVSFRMQPGSRPQVAP